MLVSSMLHKDYVQRETIVSKISHSLSLFPTLASFTWHTFYNAVLEPYLRLQSLYLWFRLRLYWICFWILVRNIWFQWVVLVHVHVSSLRSFFVVSTIAGLEFVTLIDDIMFALAKRGYFTKSVKNACDTVSQNMVPRIKGGRVVRRIILFLVSHPVLIHDTMSLIQHLF